MFDGAIPFLFRRRRAGAKDVLGQRKHGSHITVPAIESLLVTLGTQFGDDVGFAQRALQIA